MSHLHAIDWLLADPRFQNAILPRRLRIETRVESYRDSRQGLVSLLCPQNPVMTEITKTDVIIRPPRSWWCRTPRSVAKITIVHGSEPSCPEIVESLDLVIFRVRRKLPFGRERIVDESVASREELIQRIVRKLQ